ncbi:ParB/RepB/Spo0J family partition protein [Varibaculum massiliense]|uniref:ParB/RepB/Spo0J family partition protein n=1 Tax=Varibaculum massiliense TaxID=1852372 RepID=UPI00288A09B8|nr:ParB/RepB/Spo0J family partition protein [Varibaculum massiliense]
MARKKHLGRGLSALIPTEPVETKPAEVKADTDSRPADIFFGGHGHSPKGGSAKELLEPRKIVSRETLRSSRPQTERKKAENLAARKVKQARSPQSKKGEEKDDVSRETSLVPVPGARLELIAVKKINPNRSQPRQTFDEDEIAELAASIKEVGLLQPVVVRTDTTDKNAYELIMGERRLRACQLAKVDQIPAIVRENSDNKMLLDALIENLHRVQLNPLEEAAAYQQLMEDFGCTQQELSKRVSKSRPAITNALRLLRLPAGVQPKVAAGVLSAGHARALLGISDPADQEYLADRIIAEGLSVRSTEEIVALGNVRAGVRYRRSSRRNKPNLSASQELAQARWTDILDTRVVIKPGKKTSKLVIEYADEDDLARITSLLEKAIDKRK